MFQIINLGKEIQWQRFVTTQVESNNGPIIEYHFRRLFCWAFCYFFIASLHLK